MIYHNFSHTSQDNINKNKNKLSKHPRENKQNMSDKAMKELAAKRAKSGSRRGAHVLPAIDDLALVRLEKPGDQVQQRGLAAARRAEQQPVLALARLEGIEREGDRLRLAIRTKSGTDTVITPLLVGADGAGSVRSRPSGARVPHRRYALTPVRTADGADRPGPGFP